MQRSVVVLRYQNGLFQMSLPDQAPNYLHRLPKGWYTGRAWVHWSMTIDERKRGWLDPLFHARAREVLVHTLARHHLVCPAYCLMPDHAHFLWMGISPSSDLLAAAAFFRRHLNPILQEKDVRFQKQAYDHVLNEHERNREAFEDTMIYILNNPERARLVSDWHEWPYLGAAAAGYPDTDPRANDWRERFWKIHHAEVAKWRE